MPKDAVAGAVGLGGGISSVFGGFSAILVGRLLDATNNNYTLLFFIGASAYVFAVVAVHFMLPKRRRDLIVSMAPAE
jgi:MFS transporter, ACS family, hexuronate transporter